MTIFRSWFRVRIKIMFLQPFSELLKIALFQYFFVASLCLVVL